VMKIAPHGDSDVIAIVCDYTVRKEGLVKATVTGFEGKEDVKKHVAEKLPVGTEFSFRWTVKKDTAKLDDVKCEKVEQIKSHLEGEYHGKKYRAPGAGGVASGAPRLPAVANRPTTTKRAPYDAGPGSGIRNIQPSSRRGSVPRQRAAISERASW